MQQWLPLVADLANLSVQHGRSARRANGGRPPTPSDPEKQALREQNQQLQEKLTALETSLEIRRLGDSPDKKRSERIEEIMNRLTQLQQQVGWPARKLCEAIGFPYSTLRRWTRRRRQGQPVVEPPGPKPVAPLDLDRLRVAAARRDLIIASTQERFPRVSQIAARARLSFSRTGGLIAGLEVIHAVRYGTFRECQEPLIECESPLRDSERARL
jgi:transposase-like protein